MKIKISFLDLRVIDKVEKKELLTAVDRVLTHGRIVLGPEVSELEKKVAAYCGRKFAVAVNSGTDALILGLKALGIGRGEEVITTSLSWVATANAIAMVGATPVFADIQDDLNIDPASVENLITSKTKAIMPVHYTGRVCQMDNLISIAKKHSLKIIEDAAQAFGATYKGKKAGSFGQVACFSMNPMKVFGALGEAGMVLTDDRKMCDRLISLRYNGTINKEKCIEVSLNGRIDTLQAAMLLVRLPRVKGIIERRRKNALFYDKHLADCPGVIRLPLERSDEHNVYYTYTIRVKRRDELKYFLEKKGVETKIQHPILMPDQPVYKHCKKDTTNAEKILKEILCIPIHEKLTRTDLAYVADCIKRFYDKKN